MYCIFLLYYTLHTLSLSSQGATSLFLCILPRHHSVSLHCARFSLPHCRGSFYTFPKLIKFFNAFPHLPILIPTRVALEVHLELLMLHQVDPGVCLLLLLLSCAWKLIMAWVKSYFPSSPAVFHPFWIYSQVSNSSLEGGDAGSSVGALR